VAVKTNKKAKQGLEAELTQAARDKALGYVLKVRLIYGCPGLTRFGGDSGTVQAGINGGPHEAFTCRTEPVGRA
jgi:hypothetical protein